MHDQILNQEIARLQRAEILRESGRRHTFDRQPPERSAVGEGLLDRLTRLVHRPRRPRPAAHSV